MSLTAALMGLVLLGYGLALWWLFRDEPAGMRLAVAALVVGAFYLRLVYPRDYPPGFNPDEPNHFHCAIAARAADDPIRPCALDGGICVLFSALFSAPLAGYERYLGIRFVVRGYAILLGALSVAVAYTFSRALGLGQAAGFTAAALVGVLPWSLFYGRLTEGAELTFHELLLGTALARLAWRDTSGWREALIGAGALTLLLYIYWSSLAMLAWPVVAAAFARTLRGRLWCLAIVLVASLAWLPWWHVSQNQWALLHVLTGTADPLAPPHWHLTEGMTTNPMAAIGYRVVQFARSLIAPEAEWCIWSQPAVFVHPVVVLVAAALGVLGTAVRRALFLLASFALAALPALLPNQLSINGHRALLSLPFIALAAACAVQLVPGRAPRAVVAAVLAGIVAQRSIAFFFSTDFWPPMTASGFPWRYY